MRTAFHAFVMLIILSIAIIGIVSADYHAVCKIDTCRLVQTGQTCARATNVFLEPAYGAPITGPKGAINSVFWFGYCGLEGAYDLLRSFNQQRMYWDKNRSYFGRDGVHDFYTLKGCSIEIVHGIKEPHPDSILVDSDQCKAPRYR